MQRGIVNREPELNVIEGLADDKMYQLLPESAKRFYHKGQQNFNIYDPALNLIHHHNTVVSVLRRVGLFLTFPVNVFRHKLVSEDEVALANYNGQYVFKGPGRQFTLVPGINYIENVVKVNNQLIQHGPMTVVRVEDGELHYAIDRNSGDPLLLGPGSHFFNDPCIVYRGIIDFAEDKQEIGNFTFTKIPEGKIGISYRADGSINLLKHGLHFFGKPETFHTTASIQQEFIQIKESTYTTGDNVELTITASLAYILREPLLAFQRGTKDSNDIVQTLTKKSQSTLISIIRGLEVWDVGKGKIQNMLSAEAMPDIDLSKIQNDVGKQFIHDLQKNFGDYYGFHIEALDFLDFKYSGKYAKILEKIIDNTIKATEVQNDEKLVVAQTRIAEANAKKQQRLISLMPRLDQAR